MWLLIASFNSTTILHIQVSFSKITFFKKKFVVNVKSIQNKIQYRTKIEKKVDHEENWSKRIIKNFW